jgi:hypothetical protein
LAPINRSAIRVAIDEDGFMVFRKISRDMDRRCGLTDTALIARNREYFHIWFSGYLVLKIPLIAIIKAYCEMESALNQKSGYLVLKI